jgi:predicted secreted protein
MYSVAKMMALSAAAAISIVLGSHSAIAGDFAKTKIHGFSADGQYVAIEEYGVQDGSGFPYSTIFVLNIDRDSWVKGSPVKVLIEDDTAGLATARSQAADQAASIFNSVSIDPSIEADLLAANPASELSASAHSVAFNSRIVVPSIEDPMQLVLTEKPFTDSNCPDPNIKGQSLELTHQGQTRQLTDDQKVPASRNCPMRYRILSVHSVSPAAADPVLLVTLQMESYGFEGPDGRHIFVGARF